MTKKIITILLLAGLILSLVACGQDKTDSSDSTVSTNFTEYDPSQAYNAEFSESEAQAFEAAENLIKAGDYDTAIQILQAIPIYGAIQSAISRAKEQKGIVNSSFLLGSWSNILTITSEYQLTFKEDSQVLITYMDSEEYYCNYVAGDQIVAHYSGQEVARLNYEEIDGVAHLTGKVFGHEGDYVNEEAYDTLKPTVVKLSADNWSTYFEIRPWETIGYDHWGDISYQSTGYAFYLKDEYKDRLLWNGGITFYIKSDVTVTDPNDGTALEVVEDVEISAELRDYRNNQKQDNREDDFIGQVCADFTSELWGFVPSHYDYHSSSVYTINSFDRVTAEGSIALYP